MNGLSPIKTKRNWCKAKKTLDKYIHFKSKWIILSPVKLESDNGESEKMLQRSQTGSGYSVSDFTQEKETEGLPNPGIMFPAMTGRYRSS